MKKIGLYITIAIVASLCSFGVTWLALDKGWLIPQSISVKHINELHPPGAIFTMEEDEIVPLDFTQTASKAMDAVVHIKSTQKLNYASNQGFGNQQLNDPFRQFFGDQFFRDFFGPQQGFRFHSPQRRPHVKTGTGSGVIINSEGYIITNNHVIDNADEIEVTLHDNRSYKAKVVGTDPNTDLALIQIKEKDLPSIPLVNSDNVEVGEWVMAVGNPFNLNSTVTAGIVSAKGRNINILKSKGAIESFIQTDAAINPGNSGGALVNLEGGLIGINTAIASPTGAYAGYGFAVPSNIVNKVVEDILKYGVVQRGFLGVLIKQVDDQVADDMELEATSGVLVDSLLDNSAAGDAGIRVGDVIQKIDGQIVTTPSQLQELIARRRPGEKVKLEINRNGKSRSVDVTLHNSEGKAAIAAKPSGKKLLDELGAEFSDVSGKMARKLGIPGGVSVTKLYPGKLSKYTQLKDGFIITKLNNKEIHNVDDLAAALAKAEGGVLLEGVYPDYPGRYYYAFGM